MKERSILSKESSKALEIMVIALAYLHTKDAKLDYILMSPRLSDLVVAGGIERRGVWGGKHGTLFPHLPEIQKPADAASDHAALWVDLNL